MALQKEQLKRMFDKSEYETEFFKENGFLRRQCGVCGEHFWTLDENRETCGDVECEGHYRFIENRRWNSSWDIHSTIRKWEKFFEERDHSVLEPYPVVARWRDDLEFTIASIVAFQPWVTEGIVDPPANPLVIPQPCLRFGGEFSDIDNIGKTGRHLTSFTMGGQHAFNSKAFWAYWKNEYVQYNFEFMTKVLGIPPKELTYKEDIWVGGGNFGPSLETFAYGLEIVNGVFMQYKYQNGQAIPLKLKVLDVGWGLERISWFMQKTPTIYEATFGPVFEWVIKNVGLNYDRNLLVNYVRLSGSLDITSAERFKKTREQIAVKLGLTLKELDEQLGPIEAIYGILDHTKTLVFAIPDGALPSNVGGAYNLRVILRRAISLAENYGFEIDWYELLDRQIDYFSKTFKRLIEGREVIKEVWKIETQRYKHTLEKGLSELLRIIKKKKVKTIDYDILKHLYINFGLPPTSVVKVSARLGVSVNVPPNFFELIRLEKRVEPSTEKSIDIEEIIRETIGPELEGLPETRQLYYEDQYMQNFQAKIIYIQDKYLVLDKTAFYPRAGGQNDDTGHIVLETGEKIKVLNVRKIKGIIVHVLEKPMPKSLLNTEVMGYIDWDRRIALMRHHTATHIINGAARNVLGPHVWQVGADKSVDKARLDISHYRNLTFEELKEIESLSNRIVMENRQITIEVLDRTSAEKKYGFRIYQGGAVPGKKLRIVNINDWDAEACGGTHLRSTGEVGPIKIIGTRRIHDGVVRLIFVAGEQALQHIWQNETYLKSACDVVRVEPHDLPKTVKRFFEEWKDQQNLIRRLSQVIIDNLPTVISKDIMEIRDDKIFVSRIDLPHELMIEVLKRMHTNDLKGILASTIGGKTVLICNIDNPYLDLISKLVESSRGKCRKIKFGFMCTLPIDATTILSKIRSEVKKLGDFN